MVMNHNASPLTHSTYAQGHGEDARTIDHENPHPFPLPLGEGEGIFLSRWSIFGRISKIAERSVKMEDDRERKTASDRGRSRPWIVLGVLTLLLGLPLSASSPFAGEGKETDWQQEWEK